MYLKQLSVIIVKDRKYLTGNMDIRSIETGVWLLPVKFGFQIITSWHDTAPALMVNDCSSGNQFIYGKSYITVHEFGADGTWYQIAGFTLDNTVLTGAAFVGTGLFVDGINAGSAPQGLNIGESFSTMQQVLNNSARERYTRTSWSERVDL